MISLWVTTQIAVISPSVLGNEVRKSCTLLFTSWNDSWPSIFAFKTSDHNAAQKSSADLPSNHVSRSKILGSTVKGGWNASARAISAVCLVLGKFDIKTWSSIFPLKKGIRACACWIHNSVKCTSTSGLWLHSLCKLKFVCQCLKK